MASSARVSKTVVVGAPVTSRRLAGFGGEEGATGATAESSSGACRLDLVADVTSHASESLELPTLPSIRLPSSTSSLAA